MSEMTVISRLGLAARAAEQWKNQYCIMQRWQGNRYGQPTSDSRAKTYDKLIALGPYPSPEDVDEVIGNGSWTELICDTCESKVEKVVIAGTIGDSYNNSYICHQCLLLALVAIEGEANG